VVADFDLIEILGIRPNFEFNRVAGLSLQDDGAGSVVDRFDLRFRVNVVGNDDTPAMRVPAPRRPGLRNKMGPPTRVPSDVSLTTHSGKIPESTSLSAPQGQHVSYRG
jgi:hypothetical protein